MYNDTTAKPAAESIVLNATFAAIEYRLQLTAQASVITMPITEELAVKSCFNTIMPTSPTIAASEPARKRLLRSSGRSSAKTIIEIVIVHKICDWLSKLIKAGLI